MEARIGLGTAHMSLRRAKGGLTGAVRHVMPRAMHHELLGSARTLQGSASVPLEGLYVV